MANSSEMKKVIRKVKKYFYSLSDREFLDVFNSFKETGLTKLIEKSEILTGVNNG